MSACCDDCSLSKVNRGQPCRPGDASNGSARFTIALAGNPNSGKTTIFNALTGLRQKVGNYPGVTVERKLGLVHVPGRGFVTLVDLPGTYSLVSRSPDELVALEVLKGLRPETPAPDVIVAVVDASNLQRNLYLVSQLIDLERPLVIALNMVDVAERRGQAVDAAELSRRLGLPVVPVIGHKRRGIAELVAAIDQARLTAADGWTRVELTAGLDPMQADIEARYQWIEEIAEVCVAQRGVPADADSFEAAGPEPERLRSGRVESPPQETGPARSGRLEFAPQETGPVPSGRVGAGRVEPRRLWPGLDPRRLRLGRVEAEPSGPLKPRWLRSKALKLGRVESARSDPTRVASRHEAPLHLASQHRNPARLKSRSQDPGRVQALRQPANLASPWSVPLTERVDAVLLHRVWGLLIFLLVMGSMFVSMFWLAKPIQDHLTDWISALGSLVAGLAPGAALQSLVRDGIFAGVGSVVVFVPQIAILFLFLAVLEDSGYLARAAFLMDRLLARVGLHGKSFIPLLSGFACAIPAIMATRTIEHRRGRLATILVLPFMTCSARLPIYGLLVGTFFASLGPLRQAGIMLALYILGILFAAAAAFVFRRTFLRGRDSGFILELPTYKVPQASLVARQVWSNSGRFLTRAGTTIFAICLALWAISYYPRLPASAAARFPDANAAAMAQWPDANAQAAAQRAYSLAGRFGRAIEPGIRPLGFDWKMGVGCIGAFAAREVFVSTLAIVYGTGEAGGENGTLAAAMRSDRRPDGSSVWTPLVAGSLLLWFVLAMQCLSTVMVVRAETRSWRWPIFMLVYMNGLAYVACLVFYQIGSRVLGG